MQDENGEYRTIGRPSVYTNDMDDRVYKLSLLGLDDKRIAFVLGVSHDTLTNWDIEHPNFFVSRKRGRDESDAEVAFALYHRARGWSGEESKVMVVNGQIEVVVVPKHFPPDTAAANIWLSNRQKENWRNRAINEPDGMTGITYKQANPPSDPAEASRMYQKMIKNEQ